jgi:hypothetical protein
VLFAQCLQTLHKLLAGNAHTAFGLNRLEHDGDGLVGDLAFVVSQVAKVSVGEAFKQRAKVVVQYGVGLACGGKRSECATVEAALAGDYVEALGALLFDAVLTSHLDHGFIGFRSGILIEDLVVTEDCAHLFSKQSLRNGVGIVECVDNLLCLFLNGGYYLWMAAACGVNGNTTVKVKVLIAVVGIKVLTLGSFAHKIETLVGFGHVLGYEILDFLRGLAGIFQQHVIVLPSVFEVVGEVL